MKRKGSNLDALLAHPGPQTSAQLDAEKARLLSATAALERQRMLDGLRDAERERLRQLRHARAH